MCGRSNPGAHRNVGIFCYLKLDTRSDVHLNEFDRLHRIAKDLKERYPRGTRIMLLGMGDDPRPIESSTRGTVRFVDDMATIHCDFDNGRALGLAYGEDRYRKLTEQEIEEESNAICVEESTDNMIDDQNGQSMSM